MASVRGMLQIKGRRRTRKKTGKVLKKKKKNTTKTNICYILFPVTCSKSHFVQIAAWRVFNPFPLKRTPELANSETQRRMTGDQAVGRAQSRPALPGYEAQRHVMRSCDHVRSLERIMELQVISKPTDPQNAHGAHTQA